MASATCSGCMSSCWAKSAMVLAILEIRTQCEQNQLRLVFESGGRLLISQDDLSTLLLERHFVKLLEEIAASQEVEADL